MLVSSSVPIVKIKYPRLIFSKTSQSTYLQLDPMRNDNKGIVLIRGINGAVEVGQFCYLPADVEPLAVGSVVTLTQE